jgi:hypothetical protein
VQNKDHDRIKLPQNIDGLNSDRLDAMVGQQRVTLFVADRLIDPVVRVTIDFDAKPRSRAIEVEGKQPGRMLMAKLELKGAFPQLLPKQNLRKRHLASQPLRAFHSRRRFLQHRACPSTMLRMVPLPKTSLGRN